MADVLVKSKEAIVIVLDVGRTTHYDCKYSPTDLYKSRTCVSMILQRKIFSESKDEVALVLFGTDETSNFLAKEDSPHYKRIKVVQDLKPASWELLQYVNTIEGTEVSSDFIDALVVAMDILYRENEEKHFSAMKILFFSNFDAKFANKQIDIIASTIKKHFMEVIVVGPYSLEEDENDDDVDPLYKKTPQQLEGNAVMMQVLKKVNGECYTFEEALPALLYYQKKHVQSLPWNANLDIGKNLTIPISAYIKVYESKSKPWKTAYARKVNAKIERQTTLHMNDASQTEVTKENVIRAYRYGTTLVPFSEEDKVNMEYKSGEKGMKVLGFSHERSIHRYYYIGDKTMYVFGQRNRELAGVILAPFIQALYETRMVAIVRYVYSSRSAPKIGFLAPRIKSDYECLVFIQLPFMEDLRRLTFVPLDADPRNLPTEEQLAAVDELITTMDLSTAACDLEGNRGEALKPKNTVNPNLQRLFQCLQAKVFHPEAPLPEIPPHIKAIIEPNEELVKASEPVIQKMIKLFPLNENAKRKAKEMASTLFSNGKDSEDVSMEKKIKTDEITVTGAVEDKIMEVGTVNPVKDFQQLMNTDDDIEWFKQTCKQLESAVLRFLSDERINMYHDKIVSCLCEYRASAIKKEEPALFNLFMKSLKGTIISRSSELWAKIIDEKLSLITTTECFPSTVSFQEAMEFKTDVPEESTVLSNKVDSDDDENDLLAEL